MTEKDYLDNFIDFCLRNGYGSNFDQREIIDKFLETFHKEYYEVEFVKKEETLNRMTLDEIKEMYKNNF